MNEMMDSGPMMLVSILDGCAGWFVGLMLLGVGLGPVRRAHSMAGYLLGGAGAMHFLSACCGAWQAPAYSFLGVDESTVTIGNISGLLSFLIYGVMFGLVIAAGIVLSKSVSAQPSGEQPSGEQPSGGPS